MEKRTNALSYQGDDRNQNNCSHCVRDKSCNHCHRNYKKKGSEKRKRRKRKLLRTCCEQSGGIRANSPEEKSQFGDHYF